MPKNILTVEFKLFGALSVRQFMKIVVGCLLSLVLFVIPIPKLVSLPIILVVLIVSILSALIKDFEVRFWGFIRAVFVSPRYVWKKQESAPGVLAEVKKEPTENKQTVKIEKEGAAALAELSIDQLIDAKNLAAGTNSSSDGDSQDLVASSNNFESLYSQTFGPVDLQKSKSPNLQAVLSDQPTAPVITAPAPVVVPAAAPEASAEPAADPSQTAVDDLMDTVQKGNSSSADINAAFDQAKQTVAATLPPTADMPVHKYIYGIVVDKSGSPVAGASTHLLDAKGQEVVPSGSSTSDGRFALDVSNVPFGGYVMRIQHPRYSFYDFKVNYEDKKLPAYKFKAK